MTVAAILAMALLGSVRASGAPGKVVTVALDGSGDFRDVQSAVDSASAGGLVIRIKPGIYYQVVTIAADGVELHGLGAQPSDVVLTFGNSHAKAGGTAKSASTTVSGDRFVAENVTFENSFSHDRPDLRTDAQAVALLVQGDRAVFRHVRLLGGQDTLYANSKSCHSAEEIAAAKPCRASRMLFADSYIEGHVDFIFGDAKAVFLRDEIHAVAHGEVTVTAQSRVYPAEDSGYLFVDCTVTGDAGANNILLGRPWRPYSTVSFVDTKFVAPLNPEGWAEWDGRLKTSSYSEYGSSGRAGDLGKRIGSRQLTSAEAAQETVSNWLKGSDGWDPLAGH